MKTMKVVPFVFLVFLAIGQGCSPQRRLSRLLEHHPELTVTDTVVFRDTVVFPAVQYDTLLLLSRMTDTVVVEKEQLRVKLFRQYDTLYVEGECEPDTIFRENLVPVEKIKVVQPGITDRLMGKLPWLVIGLIVLLILKKMWYP